MSKQREQEIQKIEALIGEAKRRTIEIYVLTTYLNSLKEVKNGNTRIKR